MINGSSNAGKTTQEETYNFELKFVVVEVVKCIWFRWDPLAVGIEERAEGKTIKVLLNRHGQRLQQKTQHSWKDDLRPMLWWKWVYNYGSC